MNLVKYQLESTNVSIVSVSLNAGPSHSGHLHLRQVSCLSSGFPGLSNLTSSGSFIGKAAVEEHLVGLAMAGARLEVSVAGEAGDEVGKL